MPETITATAPQALDEATVQAVRAEASKLVTEDDTPVDSWYAEKLQRLLTEALYNSWAGLLDEDGARRKFIAAANVAVYFALRGKPFVPDMLLALDVELPENYKEKSHRSYFVWELGKTPEVVVEIVSDRKGGEDSTKLREYARQGIDYYVVYDPLLQLSEEPLRVYEQGFRRYRKRPDYRLPEVGLSLRLWQGAYEGLTDTWLRWCDADGNLLLTGAEAKALETVRADQAVLHAAEAEERATEARQAAALFAAKLRELGIDPDTLKDK
jgi:Uma2 family endonuclease